MITARGKLKSKEFKGEEDPEFFSVRYIYNIPSIWFVKHGTNKLIALMPEEY